MPCTTILVGKNASYDGSTLISRNDDSPSGIFEPKKLVVVTPDKQPRRYISKISHVMVDLPDDPLRYSAMPSVDKKNGIWAASGINSLDVGMTATETITSNPLVLGADPMVRLHKDEDGNEVPGGIGEEDLVVLVLPYIHSAREGVIRLGHLIEKYGTYESNGIAFSDKDEIWWFESIGGHHWIARKVDDDEVVIMPNQFGLDRFDFEDAYDDEPEENLCSADLKDFIEKNHLDLNIGDPFNPRYVFGSYSDSDHVYNTPRAWYLMSRLNPVLCKEGGYGPESDNIPWSFAPAHKVTIEDIKYLQSSHYQGTKYDCYAGYNDSCEKGKYRPIGISRTCFLSIIQIRDYAPEGLKAIEWIGFASNVFNTVIPFFTNTDVVPQYLTNTTLKVDTNNFYWSSRLIAALADAHFNTAIVHIERYQEATLSTAHMLINKYDEEALKGVEINGLISRANQEIADVYQKATDDVLGKVLYNASNLMKNGYSRSDN